MCWSQQDDRLGSILVNEYFTLNRFEAPEGEVTFQLPYGEWIRLFRRNAFIIEDLVETRPSDTATSTYRDASEHAWAQRWPAEMIWRLRKVG
jgi:hypothetical protein